MLRLPWQPSLDLEKFWPSSFNWCNSLLTKEKICFNVLITLWSVTRVAILCNIQYFFNMSGVSLVITFIFYWYQYFQTILVLYFFTFFLHICYRNIPQRLLLLGTSDTNKNSCQKHPWDIKKILCIIENGNCVNY